MRARAWSSSGESLDGLMAATHTRVIAMQAEAARLEALTWTQVLGALGAAVALALLGTAIIAHRMTRSLRRLSTAAADVAAGAFRKPLAVSSRDEIGALTRSFNAMGTQLCRMEETRQEFFAQRLARVPVASHLDPQRRRAPP